MNDAGASFDVVIPTYARAARLRRTLALLATADIPRELGTVFVIENGPRQGAEAVCDEFSGALPIRYVHEARTGVTRARNLGVELSRAAFILFIDDDIRVGRETLTHYCEAFHRHGQRAFFGGPVEADYAGPPPPAWLREFLPRSARGHSLGDTEVAVDSPLFLGGNFAVPRRALVESGCFEGPCATGAGGGGIGEEERLQARLLDAGYLGIYLPGAAVGHHVPPERCTALFALGRRWRLGATEGELSARNGDHPPPLFGIPFLGLPRADWRELVVSAVKTLQAVNLLRTRTVRFGALARFSRAAGRARGFWFTTHPARRRSGRRAAVQSAP